MKDYITIGKIIGAHGIRGELKIFPITDNVRRFNKLKHCFFTKEDGSVVSEVDIKGCRNDRGHVLMSVVDLDDRTAAEKLKGLYVSVDREDAVKLPKDSYFIADLLGLSVIDDELGNLGVVNDVFETGANQVVSIKRKGKQDLLVPFLKAVFYEVDIESKTMKVKLPDGLYELYEG